jgi:hypothetical protein
MRFSVTPCEPHSGKTFICCTGGGDGGFWVVIVCTGLPIRGAFDPTERWLGYGAPA